MNDSPNPQPPADPDRARSRRRWAVIGVVFVAVLTGLFLEVLDWYREASARAH